MPTKVQLVVGPSGRTNSEYLLARYLEVASNQIGAAAWIAPTERACDDVLEFITRKAGVIIAPRVITFPDLAAELCGASMTHHVIPVPHQRMILAQMLKDLRKSGALPILGTSAEFPGFVDAVFDFISELKGLGVSASAFERFAIQFNQDRGMRPKDREIALVITRYEELFAKHGFVDREAQYTLALDRLRTPASRSMARAIFIDGFVAFTPPQLSLIHTLSDHIDEIWISLPDDESDTDRTELYSPAASTRADLQRLLGEVGVITCDAMHNQPAGVASITSTLFREHFVRGTDATGLQLMEAPGEVGEARMVARAIKKVIQDGVSPADILVSARDLSAAAALLAEVFAEYDIPLDIEVADVLGGRPVVAALLAAASLDVLDWPFAECAGLLRSTLFHPDWPGEITDDLVIIDAEILLRLLGETRNREHYLGAVQQWAEAPEEPLQGEEESGSLLRRRHELAKRCSPFLQRFFAAWDDAPRKASFSDHTTWLHQFAIKLGFTRSAADADELARLWHELERWAVRDGQLAGGDVLQSRAEFLARLAEISTAVSVVREQTQPGCVRAVPAELAPALRYQHLYLLGLGEGSFPRFGGHSSLYDIAERNGFVAVGLDLWSTEGRLAEEMLLFYRLLTGPGHSVTLSYPAVDDKGQRLLPGTFLQNVRNCFADGVMPITRRQMIVEGIDTQPPMSRAEYRVRWASERLAARNDPPEACTPTDEHLLAAEVLMRERFRSATFGPHDGMLKEAAARHIIETQYGPRARFTATALEEYVACPFRFFMHQVLRLDQLDDPSEEIAAHRRGSAIHRALARLHRQTKSAGANVGEQFIGELQLAIAEEARRSSSPATRMLWQLECDRLRRMVSRYQEQWREFLSWWSDLGITPAPNQLEAKFGPSGTITISLDSDVIQLAGRIDRIDTAQLHDGTTGFWVFDYKTGSRPIAAIDAANLTKLQLAVYALAAEALLGGEDVARPLGIAYWTVGGGGVQPVPNRHAKTKWYDHPDQWHAMKTRLLPWLREIIQRIRGGEFPLQPRHEQKSCASCSFGRACRINQSRHIEKSWDLPLPAAGGES